MRYSCCLVSIQQDIDFLVYFLLLTSISVSVNIARLWMLVAERQSVDFVIQK